jgi:UTP-glucose-1-phosphate uridylyltransferase
MQSGKVVFCPTEGERLDTGDPAGYLDAVLRYADTQSELRSVIDRYIRTRK